MSKKSLRAKGIQEINERRTLPMKKTIIMILATCLILTFNVGVAFAEDDVSATGNESLITVPQVTSKTVTDKHGNKYKIAGISSIEGKTAKVITDFEITVYKGGKKAQVDAYKKTIVGTGRVWFHGNASDNQFTKSKSMTRGKGTYTASDSYDFLIKSLHSTHKFSCEDGVVSFYTQM